MLVTDVHAATLLEAVVFLIAETRGRVWTVICILASFVPPSTLRVHICDWSITEEKLLVTNTFILVVQ